MADRRELTLVASPLSFATTTYVLTKFEPAETVREKLRKFSIICEVSKLDERILEKALNATFKNFEDAFQ